MDYHQSTSELFAYKGCACYGVRLPVLHQIGGDDENESVTHLENIREHRLYVSLHGRDANNVDAIVEGLG